jgi:hypothetical protein
MPKKCCILPYKKLFSSLLLKEKIIANSDPKAILIPIYIGTGYNAGHYITLIVFYG